jgi:hypothetical protein
MHTSHTTRPSRGALGEVRFTLGSALLDTPHRGGALPRNVWLADATIILITASIRSPKVII